jgi:hypothetical protein
MHQLEGECWRELLEIFTDLGMCLDQSVIHYRYS